MEKEKIKELCRYVIKRDSTCVITGRMCVGDGGNRSLRLNIEYAVRCPAYNIGQELARFIQTANFTRDQTELIVGFNRKKFGLVTQLYDPQG